MQGGQAADVLLVYTDTFLHLSLSVKHTDSHSR